MLPSGELEPRDRVRSWFFYDKFYGDGPDRILSRCKNHRVTANSPTVAENFHHVMPRISRWLWANWHVDRAARVHDDAILGRAFRAVRHNYAVHFHVQILTRTGIDQPRLILTIFLGMAKKKKRLIHAWDKIDMQSDYTRLLFILIIFYFNSFIKKYIEIFIFFLQALLDIKYCHCSYLNLFHILRDVSSFANIIYFFS